MVSTIIIVTVLVSFLAFYNRSLFDNFQFNAWYIKHYNQWYRFLTYGLLHADFVHLFVNMFVLWSFSDIVLNNFRIDFPGRAGFYFFLLYVGGLAFATLYDYTRHKENIFYNAVGASGAVSAVVFASILLYPAGKIMFLLIPIPIPSWIFGIIYLIYSAMMGRYGRDNIGHNAHFWGAIFGIVFTIVLQPSYLIRFINYLIH